MILCFDIVPKEYDLWQNIWCLCLYCFGFFTTLKYNIAEHKIWIQPNPNAAILMVGTIFIMSLSSFVGTDYYSYWTNVMFDTRGNLEEPYFDIMAFTGRNYLSFRIIVWGSALLLFCIASKFMKLSLAHTSFILGACYMLIFTYGRVSLAMAIVFTGYILFFQNIKKNWILAIIGILIFIYGYQFHRSIVFAMAMIVVMPFIPFRKKWIFLYICLIPIIFIAVKKYYEFSLLTGGDLEDETASKLVNYNTHEQENSNIFGLISNFFGYGRFFVPLIMAIYSVYFTKNRRVASTICKNLIKISLGITFVATCFLFFGLDSTVMFYRFLYMSMIPLCFIIVELYKKGIWSRNQYLFCIAFGIISSMETYLYGVYKQW